MHFLYQPITGSDTTPWFPQLQGLVWPLCHSGPLWEITSPGRYQNISGRVVLVNLMFSITWFLSVCCRKLHIIGFKWSLWSLLIIYFHNGWSRFSVTEVKNQAAGEGVRIKDLAMTLQAGNSEFGFKFQADFVEDPHVFVILLIIQFNLQSFVRLICRTY